MGLWSRIKKAVKKIVKAVKTAAKWLWQKAKAIARVIVRAVLAIVFAVINIWDLLFGFLNWPAKNLTLHIFILSDNNGALVQEKDLIPSVEYARRVLKERLNIKLRPYSRTFVETLKEPAPNAALNAKPCTPSGIFQDEFGDGGEYFAKHIAGWNAAPISLRFPITVFVIRDVTGGYIGCSAGLFSDYVVVDVDGIRSPPTTMMHEIGHSCNIFDHYWTNINDLMYPDSVDNNGNIRGDRVTWGKRNLIRASRHVTYW
jgi:hypothetical protein